MKKWEQRCYFDGIPDKAPVKLERTLRVPSYRMIALAILKNDLQLKTLGFSGKESDWYYVLKAQKIKQDSPQKELL